MLLREKNNLIYIDYNVNSLNAFCVFRYRLVINLILFYLNLQSNNNLFFLKRNVTNAANFESTHYKNVSLLETS